MEVLAGGGLAPEQLRNGALALGNFDGVHRGHQAVIGRALAHARAYGMPALVATFDPHPSRHFRPGTPPFALTSLDQKLRLFEGLGMDAAVVIPFDHDLASQTPAEFADQWLVRRLGVRHVVTGSDFTFGRGRSGDAAVLVELGRSRGFSAEALAPVGDGGEIISSTRIRSALAAGAPDEAARLLGRPFTIEGVVIPGDQRGRAIGVPTANLELGPYLRPRFGVYAARGRLPDGTAVDGVANLGVRPMFSPPRELLEIWLFDWEGDLYGRTIGVELHAWLRPEAVFSSLDALKQQIRADAVAARGALVRG